MPHETTRVRYALVRRRLTVKRVEQVTANMLRLHLAGPELAGFTSLAPDDHIKIFLPGTQERRDYTPRRHDPAAGELALDFALHEAGPATEWARQAKPGDPLEIAGPRGSRLLAQDFDWWLLVGDETALPAIGRRIEALPARVPVTSVVAVTGPAEEQTFATAAAHEAVWVHRPASRADDPAPVLAALNARALPQGEGYVWIAAEASVARAVRAWAKALGHPAEWLHASGYWKKGAQDAHEAIED